MMLFDPDPIKSQQVMKAMLPKGKVGKIDIKILQAGV
jgi:hypothetical protein